MSTLRRCRTVNLERLARALGVVMPSALLSDHARRGEQGARPMTTYTDAEVDAVALAIRNAAFTGADVAHIGQCGNCGRWRDAARAALAARDALFETVDERWDVRWPVRRDEPDGPHTSSPWSTPENAHAEANEMRRGAFVGVRVVHVVTKRRAA